MVAADAVLRMHDGVAGAQFGQVAHHGFDVAGAFLIALATPAGAGQPGIQIVFGQEGEVGARQFEAGAQRRRDDAEMRVRGQEGVYGVWLRVRRDAEFVQHLHQRLAAAGRVRAQQHAGLAGLHQRAQLGDGVFGTARHADVGRGAEVWVRLARGQRQAAEFLQPGIQGLVVQKQGGRWQDRTLAVALQETVAAGRVLVEALDCVVDVPDGDRDRAFGQVVEQGGRLFEEQRQVVFDARKRDAVADVFVRQRARWIALEDLAKARAEAVARLFVHGKFAAGQELDFAYRVQAALSIHVEAADGFDLVVEQVQAVRHHRTHGKQIDQPAAQAEFAGRRHLGDVVVVGQGELRAQRRLVQLVLLLE
ncbi:hypothetical protein D3C85_845290 [compost metagenome]